MSENVRLEKENKLKDIIKRMSTDAFTSSQDSENIVKELKEIYENSYRHDYSIFFPLLSRMQEDGSQCSIETLLDNLSLLRKYIDENFMSLEFGTYQEDCKRIVKLVDHLNLEISRLQLITADNVRFKEVKAKLDNLNEQYRDISGLYEDAKKRLEKATKKANSMQAEFISILSIFSAVVLLFFVDTEYIGQAISNLQNGSFLRVVMVLCICGLVLFNGLYLMFYFISYIISKNFDEQNTFNKRIKTILIIFNFVLLVTIITCIVFWILGLKGVEPFNAIS